MYTFPIKAMKTPARRLEQSREESKYQVQVSEIEVKTLRSASCGLRFAESGMVRFMSGKQYWLH